MDFEILGKPYGAVYATTAIRDGVETPQIPPTGEAVEKNASENRVKLKKFAGWEYSRNIFQGNSPQNSKR